MAAARMNPKKATTQVDTDPELEDDEFLSDEDYFLEELRTAVARAQSSRHGGGDFHDGLRSGGMDCVQTDFAE